MSDGTVGGSAGAQVGGPAAVASALRVLDRHVRVMVRHSITQHAFRDSDLPTGVAQLHDRLAAHLHALSLEHGTDAMSTAAEYASTALDAGSIYPGDELEAFLTQVAAAVRATSKDLTRSTPFGA